MEGLIKKNRRILIKTIEENIGVCKGTVYCIIVHKLSYTKIWVQLVPRLLSEDHKCLGMILSLQHFTEYSQNGNDLLLSIIASDETWCYYFLNHTVSCHRCSGIIQILHYQ